MGRTTTALLAVVLALACSAAGAVAAAAPRATRVVYAAPVDARGVPLAADVVIATHRGSCEPGSDVLTGPVYRCGFANSVIDPCWAIAVRSGRATDVLCQPAPWSHRVIRLHTRGLPASTDPVSTSLRDPWAVELVNGDRCLAAQGAHEQFAGRDVNYYCTGRAGIVLLRGAHQRSAVWTFDSAYWSGSHLRRGSPEPVLVAWFGGWARG